MSKEGLLLQADMFTGDLVDTRTKAQKRQERDNRLPNQMNLFQGTNIGEFKARKTSLAPDYRPRMVLIAEDPRTEEEKERDLMCAAQALTNPMFVGDGRGENGHIDTAALAEDEAAQKSFPQAIDRDTLPDQEADGDEEVVPIPKDKTAGYMELVQAREEQETTLWIDPVYKRRFDTWLTMAMLGAQSVGLTVAEITAAIQIGEGIGSLKQNTIQAPHGTTLNKTKSHVLTEVRQSTPEVASSCDGYRAHKRRLRLPVRSRNLPL